MIQSDNPTPVIQLDGVTKVYKQGSVEVHALRGISVSVYPGEFVAIMGPSGSGKSTLMNIIGCLDRPSDGRYVLDGDRTEVLSDTRLAKIRNQKIGFIFQSFNLLPRMNALKNVMLPALYSRGKRPPTDAGVKALSMVGLGHRIKHTPAELSGGEQQRVAIARSLVNNPPIIFADEPTGNLDTKTSVEIMSIMQRLNNEGKTIVMVTHEQDIADHARRILRFRDGQLEADEPVSNRRIVVES